MNRLLYVLVLAWLVVMTAAGPVYADACYKKCGISATQSTISPAETYEITPGVVAYGSNIEDDQAGVYVVVVAPSRSGSTSPDLSPLLVAAWDWCANNVSNPMRATESGSSVFAPCIIEVESGPYIIGDTAVLRVKAGIVPQITVNLVGVTLRHVPSVPANRTVAQMVTEVCTDDELGDYYNVTNPDSLDDFVNADATGAVTIATFLPNNTTTAGCEDGDTSCKYGTNALLVNTTGAHGFSDGDETGLGDVITFAGTGVTDLNSEIVEVKEVVDSDTFIVTVTDTDALTSGATGTVEETDTTVWCNGARWTVGKPMIAIGGEGHWGETPIKIIGGFAVFDATLYRNIGIFLDNEIGTGSGGTGAGGVSNVDIVDFSHGGFGHLRGAIPVVLGLDADDGEGDCRRIKASVYSDSLGRSWSPSLWNRTCAGSEVTVYQGHGGGYWQGRSTVTNQPQGVIANLHLWGCRDGPCLWIKSGANTVIHGEIHGDVGGIYQSGRVAIIGGAVGTSEPQVTADGVSWQAGSGADLDCYVYLGDDVEFSQKGGYLVAGNASSGSGNETLFCSAPNTTPARFVLEQYRFADWGGDPVLANVTSENLSVGSDHARMCDSVETDLSTESRTLCFQYTAAATSSVYEMGPGCRSLRADLFGTGTARIERCQDESSTPFCTSFDAHDDSTGADDTLVISSTSSVRGLREKYVRAVALSGAGRVEWSCE